MPVELGVNPLRLHCLLKTLHAGRIGCKSIEIDAGQIGCKSIEITLYACLVESVEFGGHNINGFPPNSTGRIRLVESGVNPLR